MEVLQDKSARRYTSGVERALSLFDTTLQEWADYISFLGRLLKALQARPIGATNIPHKALVAKRLSQCLNPGLPSGVHQKTLEVYSYIFSVLNKDVLAQDLPLYLPGLSPTLSFASLSVKPALLSLFENFFLALGPSTLRPALKAIVLALLPGLEEETSDEFERSHSILNRFKDVIRQCGKTDATSLDASGDQYFWQCLFLASITSPSRRQGALAYLVRNLPRLGPLADSDPALKQWNGNSLNKENGSELESAIEAVASPEPGLLIRCFAAGLQDEQLLIQRGFLDLLVTHLPLRSQVLHHVVLPEDLERLIAAATSVVARREMSLNRRLWTWFLGPEPAGKSSDSAQISPILPSENEAMTATIDVKGSRTAHFQRHGLTPLVQSIRRMVDSNSSISFEKARPFRICLSLMDRWEIGGLVVPRIFLPALESAWRYQKLAPSHESFVEVLRSANMFFDGVESSLVWGELTKVILVAFDEEESNLVTAQERLDLIFFTITEFNIREEEMLLIHIPTVALVLVVSVQANLYKSNRSLEEGHSEFIGTALKIIVFLLDLIPERAFLLKCPDVSTLNVGNSNSIFRRLVDHVPPSKGQKQNVESATSPTLVQDVGESLLHISIQMVTYELQPNGRVAYIEPALSVLDKLIRKIQTNLSKEGMFSNLMQAATDFTANAESVIPFPAIAATVSTLETLCSALPSATSDHRIRQIVPKLMTRIWPDLSPSRPKYNVEAVRCTWRIQTAICAGSQVVESAIATLMTESALDSPTNSGSVSVEAAHRFATLWAHTKKEVVILARPLLLLLDSLCDPKTEVFNFCINWLQGLSSIHKIVDFLVGCLQKLPCLTRQQHTVSSSTEQSSVDLPNAGYDLDECLYYLRTISNLIQYSSDNIWPSLSSRKVVRNTDPDEKNNSDSNVVSLIFLTEVCLVFLTKQSQQQRNTGLHNSALRQAATSLLQQMLLGPSSALMLELDIEVPIIDALTSCVTQPDIVLQVSLMDLMLVVLRLRTTSMNTASISTHRRTRSADITKNMARLSFSTERSDSEQAPLLSSPPGALLNCLMLGLSSENSHPVIGHWTRFLDDCLPFYASSAFQVLMPLVEGFIKSIRSVFTDLQASFDEIPHIASGSSEPSATIISLFNGLEQTLARAHDRLSQDEVDTGFLKIPEQGPSFFGNMVSGVFASDTHRSKTTTANNRLTVLLCFKDTIRICVEVWSWNIHRSESPSKGLPISASYTYTSLRIRNRSRRILEHLFAAEALECLETLIEIWYRPNTEGGWAKSGIVFDLLNVLDGSKPKNTIPAIFNAMYSRTNPAALDPLRKSTMTSELSDINLAEFLVAYTRSLEDDAMDEVWSDCMVFLRDVLANPLPHRQTLQKLLEFTAILGEKVDNTNFGEQRRMRRDLGDLFSRLLAATFTIKPLAFSHEASSPTHMERAPNESSQAAGSRKTMIPDNIVSTLASILPNLSKILIDTDRIAAATTIVSTQILAPTFRWKTYPQNVTKSTLDILYALSRIPEASKTWRKDVADAFNDPRFFCASSLDLAVQGWLPVLRHWTLVDKDRMPEYLSRLSPPTSAGIMFGVGASSARLEADRKTQLNLRRMAVLMLAAADDTFIVSLASLQGKLVELLTATTASSPSSTTRAEVFMLLGTLTLKNSPVHLASLWPIISSEIYDVLSSLLPGHANHEMYNVYSVLQACKLLNTLLIVAPDDFQMREWLFITDTIDAVYRPSGSDSVALVDELARLDSNASMSHATTPLMNAKSIPKEELVDRVLRPFFRQLSINTFESTYRMEAPDWKTCYDGLLVDLFDDSTLV